MADMTLFEIMRAIVLIVLGPLLVFSLMGLLVRGTLITHRIKELCKKSACEGCGKLLGLEAYERGMAKRKAIIERGIERKDKSVRVDILLTFDVICSHCGTPYKYLKKTRQFIRIEELPN